MVFLSLFFKILSVQSQQVFRTATSYFGPSQLRLAYQVSSTSVYRVIQFSLIGKNANGISVSIPVINIVFV